MEDDRVRGPYSRVANTHNRAGQAVAVALLAVAVNASRPKNRTQVVKLR